MTQKITKNILFRIHLPSYHIMYCIGLAMCRLLRFCVLPRGIAFSAASLFRVIVIG